MLQEIGKYLQDPKWTIYSLQLELGKGCSALNLLLVPDLCEPSWFTNFQLPLQTND